MTAAVDVIDQAIAQVELGFAAFALQRNGKKPITEHGFKNATRNPEWIRTQMQAPAAGNYGIVWPEDVPDRVLALDLDNGSDGQERPWQDRLAELIERIGPLTPTKATTTPSGGRHAFYRWPAGIPIPAGDELFGFTVRWPGRGYLVGPGSAVDGIEYLEGPTHEIADLPPEWVAAAIEDRRGGRGPSLITISGGRYELPAVIPSGRRYATIRDFVASRYNDGLPLDELWELVRAKVAPRFAVPKSEPELRADFDRVVAKIDERLGPPRLHGGAPAIPTGPLTDAPLTDFASTPVEWLWPAWLPRGVVTLMDGNPGVSKSTLVADLVARITTGREWPDGSAAPPLSRVMWITTEDDPGRVLRPRVEAAGGNASLVRFVLSEVVFPSGAGAFRELVVQRAAEPEGLALVVLDPLFSHIEASVRTIADAEMRKGVMNPLAETAELANVALLVVRHFNKDSTASAINRGAGSLGGIVGSARALWSVTLDPEDDTGETKVVGVAKLNYARPNPPLRYRVVDRLPIGWVAGSVSGIEWIGESAVSIGALMEETSSIGDAMLNLREILANGSVAAADALNQMRARGFGRDAARGAFRRLHIDRSKEGFGGRWVWSLPAIASEVTSIATPDGMEASEWSHAGARAGGAVTSDDTVAMEPHADPSSDSLDDMEGVAAIPTSADSISSEASDLTALPAGARPREGQWAIPCQDYAGHRGHHRRAKAGWICDTCNPEAAA